MMESLRCLVDTEHKLQTRDQHSRVQHRLAIRFKIDGDLRFISHHDTVRLFERALARAAIPMRFSQGFNPRPQLSLPLPRSVGMASDDETLIVECSEPMEREVLLQRLRPQMPEGLALQDADVMHAGERRIPLSVEYGLDLGLELKEKLAQRICALETQERLEVTRREHRTGQSRTIDIRPYLLNARLNGSRLEWTQAILASGTARPAEIMEVFGLPPKDFVHRIRRLSVAFAQS